MTNRIDPTRLAEHLWLGHVEHRASVPSTNDLAVSLAAQSRVSLPALVIADRQTAGRGRGANRWWSTEGALTFSLLTTLGQLGLESTHLPRTSLATALAVTDALFEFAPDSDWRIKWPNDVLIGPRKICGILIEAPNIPKAKDSPVVLGVGLNVNNRRRDAPGELQEKVASLYDVSGSEHELTEVLYRLLTALERRLRQLSGEEEGLANDWQSRCALRGTTVEVENGGQTIRGLCQGIDAEGRLMIECDSRIERLACGVVTGFAF